jgi:hypothetical protein
LSLIAPDTTVYTVTTPGIEASTTTTSTVLCLENPQPGIWQLLVEDLSGSEEYETEISVNGDGSYSIGALASSRTPTSTISLFYDLDSDNRTGQLIVQDLSLNSTNHIWRPDALASGVYHIYAMVDDPLDGPAYAYASETITVTDITPPPVPTGLTVSGTDDEVVLSWNTVEAPDFAGYRLYYTEPGSGLTSVIDLSGDASTFTLGGLYLAGD